ncbi:MAG TPA: DNA-primase RepB domain-containing protein [Vicinamibacterales bacterium]|nr:DNA-primase RepB domain-containing protein [Vicinamibacterales bacterium]
MSMIEPSAPLRLLRAGYAPDDWVAVFLKSYATGETCQRVLSIPQISRPEFLAWLRARNARAWNVYVSVNAVSPQGRSRSRQSVMAVRHVFLEADEDGPRVLARTAACGDLPPPSYVLHSSRRRVHVFWRVAGFDIPRVEALQKQLARELKTDTAATSCSQLTRLPGLFNHKRQPAELVTMVYGHVGRVYGIGDFPAPKLRVEPTIAVVGHKVPADWRLERARRYLAALPPAIAGSHGDLHTFRVCCRLVRGFALDDDEAFVLLQEWNARCLPPWTDRELEQKIASARRYGREPIGGLLEAQR